MTSATLGQLIDAHGFDVLSHLDREAEIPVLGGLQAQGDLLIIPLDAVRDPARSSIWDALDDGAHRKGTPVPAAGIPVIKAVSGGHEHRLFAGTPGTAFWAPSGRGGQDIGLLECTAPAFVAHPEHAYTGIAPGTYLLRRQREQAQEERLVAD